MKQIKVQDISSPAMKQWYVENKELVPFATPPQHLIDEANQLADAWLAARRTNVPTDQEIAINQR